MVKYTSTKSSLQELVVAFACTSKQTSEPNTSGQPELGSEPRQRDSAAFQLLLEATTNSHDTRAVRRYGSHLFQR